MSINPDSPDDLVDAAIPLLGVGGNTLGNDLGDDDELEGTSSSTADPMGEDWEPHRPLPPQMVIRPTILDESCTSGRLARLSPNNCSMSWSSTTYCPT